VGQAFETGHLKGGESGWHSPEQLRNGKDSSKETQEGVQEMRRLAFVSLLCSMVLLLGSSTQAETWSTGNGDFTTKFWKEMFKGGGHGQPGNTLMALGEGFHFKKATLESTYFDPGANRWITTYVDGELTLNSKGPWLHHGILRARNITATNSSFFDPNSGVLDFVLTFSGEFDNRPGVTFEIEASYNGIPEIEYEGDQPIFMRGYDFDAIITIEGL
jgi:hypothetical protein